MTKYRGTIVEESLTDNRVLNEFEILKVRITNDENPENRWHLYTVITTQPQIEQLSHYLKNGTWYAHFWAGDKVIAIFLGKTFTFQHSLPTTWNDAILYGKSLGIPEEQLDFVLE
jgi:hypothetical protein